MEHSEHQMYPNYFTSAPVEPTVAFSGTPTDQYDESVKEGGIAQITTTAIHGHDSRVASSTDVANPEPRAWTTSFFRLGPLSGIFCILVAMGSIIAALGILVGSRGAAVTTWTIPPVSTPLGRTPHLNLRHYACAMARLPETYADPWPFDVSQHILLCLPL